MFYYGEDAAFRLRISGLKDYLNYLEEIEKVIEEKRSIVKQMGDRIPDEDQEEYWYHYIDDYDKYDVVFPEILRKSIFTSLFAYFENQLMEFCEDKNKLKDVKGIGIDKAKEYISKHLGCKDLFQEEEWASIKKYSKVRNCLVHAGGVLYMMKSENEQDEIRRFSDTTKGITVDEGDGIVITSVFCEEFVTVAYNFLTKTFNEIKEAP